MPPSRGGSVISRKSGSPGEKQDAFLWSTFTDRKENEKRRRDALRSCDWGSQLIDMAEAELPLILTKTNVGDEILSWKQSSWCLGMNACYYWRDWSSRLIEAACCWRRKLFTFDITMAELVCDQGAVAGEEEVTSG